MKRFIRKSQLLLSEGNKEGLPPELWVRIWINLDWRSVPAVSRVCRGWRKWSLSSPELWTEFEYNDDHLRADDYIRISALVKGLDIFLQRSDPLPFSLDLFALKGHSTIVTSGLQSLLCFNRHRIRKLVIHAFSATFTDIVACGPFPLDSLTICQANLQVVTLSDVLTLNSQNGPDQLIFRPWRTWPWNDLPSARLPNVSRIEGVVAERGHLMHILQACPNLRALSVVVSQELSPSVRAMLSRMNTLCMIITPRSGEKGVALPTVIDILPSSTSRIRSCDISVARTADPDVAEAVLRSLQDASSQPETGIQQNTPATEVTLLKDVFRLSETSIVRDEGDVVRIGIRLLAVREADFTREVTVPISHTQLAITTIWAAVERLNNVLRYPRSVTISFLLLKAFLDAAPTIALDHIERLSIEIQYDRVSLGSAIPRGDPNLDLTGILPICGLRHLSVRSWLREGRVTLAARVVRWLVHALRPAKLETLNVMGLDTRLWSADDVKNMQLLADQVYVTS